MTKAIKIDNRYIGQGRPVFIIAEAGVNHNGSLKTAKKMIDAAKFAGADAIKFQAFKAEDLVTKDAPKADYQRDITSEISQLQMLKGLEFSENEFRVLSRHCKNKKITFLATPFDSKSSEILHKIGIPVFKIASGDLTDIPLLLKIARYKKPIILSTGMASLKEVKKAVNLIYSTGNKDLILLHCTSDYPAKYEEVNLKAMDTLKREFGVPIGYSDHTPGIEISQAASAIGACVIEKHFTLDRDLPGPDHKASLEPHELKNLVKSIRNIEKAMGNGIKKPQKSEIGIKIIARKSIVASCDISKGSKMTREMLAIKRPGTGICPSKLDSVVGKLAKKDFFKDELIKI